MRSTLVPAVIVAALAPLAAAQDISVATLARGNMPEEVIDGHVYHGADWMNAGYHTTREARARGDAWDPPFTESFAHAEFDQSRADGAVLRANGVARQPYRGRYHNPDEAWSSFNMGYDLEVVNLSNTTLNIVLGTEMHGTFGQADQGIFICEENVTITGQGYSAHAFNSVQLDDTGLFVNGPWTNSLAPIIYDEELYHNVEGYALHAFEFFPAISSPPNSSRTLHCDVLYSFQGIITANASGLARYDFGNTGYLRVQAFDPVTGEDRSAEIGVAVVVTPACGTADFDGDGDVGTDADIEAFFACLGGNCCPLCFPGGADFNGDGDVGTDADIEAFFRVLGGSEC